MKRQHPTDPNLFWCPKCQDYREKGKFYKSNTGKDGIGAYCKKCTAHHLTEWAKTNQEKIKEYRKKTYTKHLAERRLYNAEKSRDRYRQNPEKNKAIKKRAYTANPEHFREVARKYRRSHPKEVAERLKKSCKKNIEGVTDSYVLNKMRYSNYPRTHETIELIRQRIIMKRTLKQFKKWREEYESDCTDVHGKQRADEENHERGIQTRRGCGCAAGI